MHRSGHALLSIINDILDFSKIEAGQLVIDSIPFDPVTTFQDVIELMESKADEKQLKLSMSISGLVRITFRRISSTILLKSCLHKYN